MKRKKRTRRAFIAITLVGTLSIMLAGCGDGVSRIPVTGKVTYGGGNWPAAGVINVNPLEPAEGQPRLNGTGNFDTDGVFTITAVGKQKGLVPGTYTVNIECWETPPEMGKSPGKSYVPASFKYPEIVIAAGDHSKEIVFDVPKP